MSARAGRLQGIWVAIAVGAGLALGACGGADNAPTATPTLPAKTAPPLPSPTGTQPPSTAVATATATATASAATASASATASGRTRQDVIAATAKTITARYISPLNRDACLKDNPQGQLCFDIISSDTAIQRGIARALGGDPAGGGFAFLMGRNAAGEWQFWHGTQQEFYELFELPGKLRVCNGGSDAPVRTTPSVTGELAGRVKESDTLQAEEFVLTKPGSIVASPDRPQGFYRITSPIAGWIDTISVTNATLGDCKLHDAVLGISHG